MFRVSGNFHGYLQESPLFCNYWTAQKLRPTVRNRHVCAGWIHRLCVPWEQGIWSKEWDQYNWNREFGLTCTWALAFDCFATSLRCGCLGFHFWLCIPPAPCLKWTSDWLCLRNTFKGGRWVGPKHSCPGPGWPQGPKNGPRQCDQRELEERRTYNWGARTHGRKLLWSANGFHEKHLLLHLSRAPGQGGESCQGYPVGSHGFSAPIAAQPTKINSRWLKELNHGKQGRSAEEFLSVLSGYRIQVKTGGRNHRGKAWEVCLHKDVNKIVNELKKR